MIEIKIIILLQKLMSQITPSFYRLQPHLGTPHLPHLERVVNPNCGSFF